MDKKRIAATFSDHEGVLASVQMAYSSQQLVNYLRKHCSNDRVALAYEVGPTGFGLYDDLEAAGYRCLVVAPSMVPSAPGKRVKTNRLDSKKISLALRGGQLQSFMFHLVSTAVASFGSTARQPRSANDSVEVQD